MNDEKVLQIYREAIRSLVSEVEAEDPIVLPVEVQHMKEEILAKTIKEMSGMIFQMVNIDKTDPGEVMFVLASMVAKLMTENFGVMYGRLKELPDQQYVQMFSSWIYAGSSEE